MYVVYIYIYISTKNISLIFKQQPVLKISIYVIVMGIIKCEKVFAGIFILIENKLEKLKIRVKFFFARMIPISITYIVLFSSTQII